MILREQVKVLQHELGDDGDDGDRTSTPRRSSGPSCPRRYEKKLIKELDRLAKQPFGSAEAAVIRNYLDVCLELPWNRSDRRSGSDVEQARKILDRDHYGLEKVKERILEFIAVRQLTPGCQGADHLPGGPSGRGQDLHRHLRGQGYEPEAGAASVWAVCGTRRISAATARPTLAPCPAASSRPSVAQAAHESAAAAG